MKREAYLSERNSDNTKQFHRKFPSGFYLRIFLSPSSKDCSQMSFLRSHKNSDLKLLNPKKGLTLWDENTHRKAIPQKVSPQVSSEDVSLLIISLQASLNIPSQIIQRWTFETGQHRVSINSVKWMHISESRFLERFFLVFISVYFTIHHSPQCNLKYEFFGFTGTVFKHCLVRKEV